LPLHARETILGNEILKKNTNWKGIIIIRGDIVVAQNAILTVAPDTKVLFAPDMDKAQGGKDKTRSELIIKGILIVKGQANHPVLFSSGAKAPQMGDWYGIELLNKTQISILNYATVEYAYNGVTIKKNNSQVSNCQIRLNYHAGLSIDVRSKANIFKNIISENGYAGVITSLGAQPVFSENLISLNQNGIIAFSLSMPNLGTMRKGPFYNKGQNQIIENREYNIYNHSRKPIMAQNNTWGSKSKKVIAEKIYDGNNEPIYGKVNFSRQYGRDIRQQLIAVATATPTVAGNNPSTPVKQNARDTVSLGDDDISQEVSNQAKVETSKKTLPLAVKKDVPPAKQKTFVSNVVRRYDRIFLEVMLDDKKAKILKIVAPNISDAVLNIGIKGRVIIRLLIDRSGHVAGASVIKGLNDYYDRLALEAASKVIYKIGTFRGIPVRFYTNMIFQF